ncbi:MAG: cytochrome c maturation protein CcmE [Pseudomonadota bacterium]
MTARRQRIIFVLLGLAGLALASTLILSALGNNLSYFFSPTEVHAGQAPDHRSFRVGGMVKADSIVRAQHDLSVHFVLTDYQQEVPVTYTGILPDLFAEGQGAIAQGRLGADGVFLADEVLAKHDENYMPPEVAAALAASEQARLHSDTTGQQAP